MNIKRDVWITAKVKVTRDGKVLAKVPAAAVKRNPMNLTEHLTPKGKAIANAIEAGITRYRAKHGPVNIDRHADWDAPEFKRARILTEKAGLVWDFDGWVSTLGMLHHPSAKIGGVSLARKKPKR